MIKFSTIFLASIITVLLLVMSINVDAKGSSFGGRSSSSSSFSRSSSSSRSYSPSHSSSSSSSHSSSRSVSSGGFGGRSSSSSSSSYKSEPIRVTRDNVMSSIGKKGAQGAAAGVLYKDFQTRNSPPVNTKSTISRADVDKVFTPQYRQSRRTDYYGGYRPQSSPHYTQHVNSGYGIWDYLLFASILDNVGDRGMYYHHQNDPSFQQWRTDANAACAAGDQDVCDKLKDLDREMAEYKAKGTPINPAYVTPGVDPDIYEANNIDMSKLAELKICTGSIGSDYSRYAATITKITKLKVRAVPTNGSIDTIAKMATGECNLGFIQDDIASPNLIKIATMNQLEVGLLICNKDSKVKTVDDLTDKHTIFVGSDQTGSQFTLNELRKYNTHLNNVIMDKSQTALQAANTVQSQPNSCFFAVSTPDSPPFKSLDASNKAWGVPIFSFNMTKGQPYKLVTTKAEHYKNLTQEQYLKYGLMTPGGTDTIAVSTSLVAPQSWIDQNKELFSLLSLEKINIQTSLQ